jgi:hypothetical protein
MDIHGTTLLAVLGPEGSAMTGGRGGQQVSIEREYARAQLAGIMKNRALSRDIL